MAYDGKALARARAAIQANRQKNEDEHFRRRGEVFARVPEIADLEAEMTQLMTSLALEALKRGTDAGQAVKEAKVRSEVITQKRAQLLTANGFPEDYIDEIYSCPRCRDTGYVKGEACSCLEEIYRLEQTKLLSSVLNLGEHNFDRFDLSLYEPENDASSKQSVRSAMATVFELCRQYADNFGEESKNLIFKGSTGLGKTFLSASIARVVSEKGFSVVYETCVSAMDVFETQKFNKTGENFDESSSQVRRILNCDLLILDDLGTEMSTAFTQSALYTIINTRLVSGGKTIISTNLPDDALEKRYSPQIMSRIWGEYLSLNFTGRDIRAVKRERA